MAKLPDKFHWSPTISSTLKELGPDIEQDMLDALHFGSEHYREYKYLEERAKDSKERAATSLMKVLPFLEGKAECLEGSFTLGYSSSGGGLDLPKLKEWLVKRGVDAELVAQGVSDCTKPKKPGAPFVKWNPAKKKGA